MNEPVICSLLDTLSFAVHASGLLFFSLFRLDEKLVAPWHGYHTRRPQCGADAHGKPILFEPRGRRAPSTALVTAHK